MLIAMGLSDLDETDWTFDIHELLRKNSMLELVQSGRSHRLAPSHAIF